MRFRREDAVIKAVLGVGWYSADLGVDARVVDYCTDCFSFNCFAPALLSLEERYFL